MIITIIVCYVIGGLGILFSMGLAVHWINSIYYRNILFIHLKGVGGYWLWRVSFAGLMLIIGLMPNFGIFRWWYLVIPLILFLSFCIVGTVCQIGSFIVNRIGLYRIGSFIKARQRRSLWWTRMQLRSKDSLKRGKAAKILGDLKNKRTVKVLIGALKDESSFVCDNAAEALGKIGEARAVQPLIERFNDNRSHRVAQALELLNWRPVDDNQRAIYYVKLKKWNEVIEVGTLAIEEMVLDLVRKDRDALAELEKWLKELCGIHDARTVTLLITLAGDKRIENLKDGLRIRKRISEAIDSLLGNIRKSGTAAQLQPLIAALESKGKKVRGKAAEALKSLDWQPTDDTQKVLFYLALHDLERILEVGTRATQPLINALGNEEVQGLAIIALGKIGDPRAVEAIADTFNRAFIEHSRHTASVAAGVLESLGYQPTYETQKAMIHIARERWNAAARLGPVGVELLIKEASSGARREIAQALIDIGDVRGTELLIKVLLLSLEARSGWYEEDYLSRKEIVDELQIVIRQNAHSISTSTLHKLASLPYEFRKVDYHDDFDGQYRTSYQGVSCSLLKGLARNELERRRIKA